MRRIRILVAMMALAGALVASAPPAQGFACHPSIDPACRVIAKVLCAKSPCY